MVSLRCRCDPHQRIVAAARSGERSPGSPAASECRCRRHRDCCPTGRPTALPKSALQQARICGLENPGFPYPAEPAKDLRVVEQVPPTQAASCRYDLRRSIPLRSSLAVVAETINRELNGT